MSQDFLIEIRVALATYRKNQAWLAKKLGISTPYMSDIMNGKRRPDEQAHRIKAILEGLEKGVYEKEE